ncbi:MAG: DUF4340 domain-containing protein [Gammaproteobacteria bacterium]|nr:DUF4340 domain-containing protein [Gammaproteobacteria bacterium]
MGKRAWLNLVLLAVILGLAAIVYFEPGIKQPVVQSLTKIDTSAVKELQISVPDQAPITLQRDGQRWRLTAPKQILANPVRVQRILGLLAVSSEQQYASSNLDLNKYGLATPKVRLRVAGQELAFGDQDPLNSRRYVLIGQTLHLIDQSDIAVLTSGWPSLVDLRLIPDGQELAAIEITGLGKLERGKDGWKYRGSGKTKTPAQTRIDELIQSWREAQAMEVAINETEATGEQAVLKFVDGSELKFDVNRFADQVVFGRADLEIEYHLSSDQAQQLLEFKQPDVGTAKDKQGAPPVR